MSDPTTGEAKGRGLSRRPADVRARIESLEAVLERMFTIPGTRRQVGLDVILDFVPVLGPTAAAVLGSYLAWEARNLGMSRWAMVRMAGNIGVDWLLGLIPWVGAVPDFFFRSNSRNLRMVKRHLDKHHPETGIVDVSARPIGGGRP